MKTRINIYRRKIWQSDDGRNLISEALESNEFLIQISRVNMAELRELHKALSEIILAEDNEQNS